MRQSFLTTEPSLSLSLDGPLQGDVPEVLTAESARALVTLMTTLPNGVERMSSAVAGEVNARSHRHCHMQFHHMPVGLVETSSNLGYVRGVCPEGAALPHSYVLESYCRSMLSQWHLDRYAFFRVPCTTALPLHHRTA